MYSPPSRVLVTLVKWPQVVLVGKPVASHLLLLSPAVLAKKPTGREKGAMTYSAGEHVALLSIILVQKCMIPTTYEKCDEVVEG